MIRVLQSFPRPGKQTNPYLAQVVASLPSDVTVLDWSWHTALLAPYDIMHMHWPELLFRREDRVRTAAHGFLFALLMLRIATSRIAIVRTVHNLAPHEAGGRMEITLLAWCDRLTARWIVLNDETRLPAGRRSVLIPHGHYRDWYVDAEVPSPVPGRLSYFGIVRTYKGVLDLVAAFQSLPGDDLSLRLLGRPHPGSLRATIEEACELDHRIEAALRFIEDDELVQAIGESELIVLPYRNMHNSGSLLLALSLGRPVLVPDTQLTRALAEEVGPGWVLTYSGQLSPAALATARDQAYPRGSSSPPDLGRRDWPALGIALRAVYRDARERR